MADHRNITAGIYTMFTTDQTSGSLYDQLTGRIYVNQAPQNVALPHMVYSLSPSLVFRTMESKDIQGTMLVSIYGTMDGGQIAVETINDKLFDAFDASTFTATGYSGNQVVCVDRGIVESEEDAIVIRSAWTVYASAD